MIKTFTVHAIHHQEVSPGKGSVIWLLSDEKGKPRKITAITDIDNNGAIVAAQAVYKRETPLVERLRTLVKSDKFTLDFSDYNAQEDYIPREAYNNMRLQEKTGRLGSNFTKIALSAGALAALWLAYMAIVSVSQLHLNQM